MKLRNLISYFNRGGHENPTHNSFDKLNVLDYYMKDALKTN